MFTKEQLIEKYKDFSTEKLVKIASSGSDNYTPEAIEAANELIEKKGGRQALEAELQATKEREKVKLFIPGEKKEIYRQVKTLLKSGLSEEEIYNHIPTGVLGEKITKELIASALFRLNKKRENQRITNKTIGGCVIGGLTGFSICTALYYSFFHNFRGSPDFVIGGFAIIIYFLIYLITKQTFKNILILIVSLVMAALAYFAGILAEAYIF